ncbi:MAG: cytochrome c [Candidatus Binataceae bacterium]
MKLANLAIGLLCLAAVPIALTGCMKPSAIRAPIGGIVLKSQRIEIPSHGREFAGGPQASVANTYCLMCHSGGMVLTQPPLSLPAWKAELNKMIKSYGCPLPEGDIDELAQFIQQQNQLRAAAE